MNPEIERIVASHRAALGRRLDDLDEVRRPRQLTPRAPRTPGSAQSPQVEVPDYRPKSWLI